MAAHIRVNTHILFLEDEEFAVQQPVKNSKKRTLNPQNHKKVIVSKNYNKGLVKKRPNETRPRRPRGECFGIFLFLLPCYTPMSAFAIAGRVFNLRLSVGVLLQ